MKIGQITDGLQPAGISPTSGQGSGTGSGPVQGVAAPAAVDQVQLSQMSQQLTGSDASINVDKVAQVRQAVSDGTFVVDPAVVADRMLNEAAHLLQQLSGAGR
jgi:flagellar biosynthesis anti-sigma factor FlgM